MSAGWRLTDDARAELLARFPPRYERAVAHHVTLPGRKDSDPQPPPANFAIVGRADDSLGVEAMVVAKDGDTNRVDGGTWHITWSLARGREARESNDVIAELGYAPFEGGPIATFPAKWD